MSFLLLLVSFLVLWAGAAKTCRVTELPYPSDVVCNERCGYCLLVLLSTQRTDLNAIKGECVNILTGERPAGVTLPKCAADGKHWDCPAQHRCYLFWDMIAETECVTGHRMNRNSFAPK